MVHKPQLKRVARQRRGGQGCAGHRKQLKGTVQIFQLISYSVTCSGVWSTYPVTLFSNFFCKLVWYSTYLCTDDSGNSFDVLLSMHSAHVGQASYRSDFQLS